MGLFLLLFGCGNLRFSLPHTIWWSDQQLAPLITGISKKETMNICERQSGLWWEKRDIFRLSVSAPIMHQFEQYYCKQFMYEAFDACSTIILLYKISLSAQLIYPSIISHSQFGCP